MNMIDVKHCENSIFPKIPVTPTSNVPIMNMLMSALPVFWCMIYVCM